ncbi:MAG: restriction endonuclease subunit S [Candidatus Accumulibacter sp.]|jgi:type I restriction enzyme S subunit|nr:restriction endonuclease subunit S [Accumulibacter sp.]
MSLLDLANQGGRAWTRIGDSYGVTKKPRDLDVRSHATIPFIPMESVPQGGAYEPVFSLKSPDALTSGTYFERGDVLVSKITPSFENGKQAFVQSLPLPFGYATTEVIPLRPFEGGKHDPRLLFFYLLHPDVRHYVAERMEGSTGRQRVPEGVLLDLPMPDIELQEQTRAADTLEMIQAAMAVEDKAAENAQELKRAAMTRLFTRGLRGEASRETEIGLVPESWDILTINDVALATQYGLSVRGQPQGRFPILRMNCQDDGRVVFRDLQYVDLDEATFAAFRLEAGDLLFNRTNSIEHVGRTAIFEDECDTVFASYLVRLRVNASRCVPQFLNYFMNRREVQSDIKRFASRAVGQANINATKLRMVAFPLPATLDEQREIVAILDALDRKIALHRQKRAVLEELFQSLLHKLMTSEIRIADLDLSALLSDR